MRVSLATRFLFGYILIIALLGSVAVFSILSMGGMARQVALIREDLLPVGSSLEQLSRETGSYINAFKRNQRQGIEWLRQVLPGFNGFNRLEKLAARLDKLAGSGMFDQETAARLQLLSHRVIAIVEGDDLSRELASTMGRAAEGGAGSSGAEVANNRDLFKSLVLQWSEDRGDEAAGSGVRREVVRNSLRFLLRGLREIQSDYNSLADKAWESAHLRETQTVVAAGIFGGVSVLISLGLMLLGLRWLAPIRKLRTLADQIAKGRYELPARVGLGSELGDLADDLRKMAQRLREREEMIRSQSDELLKSERMSAIGKMSTQIAHEIRNPLNAMGLRIEILEEAISELEGEISPEQLASLQEYTGFISREVERLTGVTDYYLRFARFPRPQKEHIDLVSVIEDLMGFFRHEARSQGVEVIWELPDTLPVFLDGNLLRQAMLNLLKNSLEAMGGSPSRAAPEIRLRAWKEESFVRVRLQDNGPGISLEDQLHIFEPFYSTKEGGTGLGLTLVQQIIREHGGQVSCTSEPGTGTAFVISLPV